MPRVKKEFKGKLKRIEAIFRLTRRRLKSLFKEITDIEEDYNRDRYAELINQIKELCDGQQELVKEIITINNERVEENPDIHYLILFVRAMRELLHSKDGKKTVYSKKYGLRSPLIGDMVQLTANYEGFQEGLHTREGHDARKQLEEIYPTFVDVEFGLTRIGDLCIQIEGLAENCKDGIKRLISPTRILETRDNDMGSSTNRGEEEEAEKKVKESVAKNIEEMEKLMEENKVDITVAKDLKKDFVYYGVKNQFVISKIKELRG
jgi:hypothetical protein